MGQYDNNFLCVSCGSPQVNKDPFKDPFIQEGQGGGGNPTISPCRYCGGVVIYVENDEDASSALESYFKSLGLPNPRA